MMQKRLLLAVPLASLMIGGSASMANANDVWDRVAECESGGNWSTNTGNGFHGGLQFTPSTWSAYGGSGSAENASKSEQIRVAQNVLEGQGPGAWPTCSQKAGLTKENGGAGSNEPAPEPSAEPTQEPTPAPTQEAPSPEVTPEPAPTEEPQAQATEEVAPEQAPAPTEAPAPENNDATEVAPEPQAPESTPVDEAPENVPAPQDPASNNSGTTYVVKSGDTLGKIAEAHNIVEGWEAIYEMNSDSMSSPHVLHIGQELTLPQ